MSDIFSALKDLKIAIENAKEQCDLAIVELKKLKAENDTQIKKMQDYIKGIGSGF